MTSSDNRHVTYVRDLSTAVTTFQAKSSLAKELNDSIQEHIAELIDLPYEKQAFQDCLAKIQKCVDQLHLESFGNLEKWTGDLDNCIESILATRGNAALKVYWCGFMVAMECGWSASV